MNKREKIYILCGAGAKSGGAELAHQFCNAVNRLTSVKARMCYVDLSANLDSCLPADVECVERYRIYETEHARDVQEMDQENNIVVVPEGLTLAVSLFQKARIAIWWMSVDNYLVATKGNDLDFIRERCSIHLVQSYYARKHVEHNFQEKPILWLTDYIRQEHGTFLYPSEYRNNAILYNPAKGYEITQTIMEQIDWLPWIPITGRSVEEVIFLMQSSKIYVDFGNHPGKDRIPREAAANGCCVITNKEGSAAFFEDVPIPEKYKFKSPAEEIDRINTLIHQICDEHQVLLNDFFKYRNWIKGEKERFENEVKIFVNDYIER